MGPPSADPDRGSPSLVAVLPAYNEAENLPEVVTELAGVLAEQLERWSIIVVDDGSTDDTPATLRRLRDEIPELRWIRLPRNSGKSQALRAAFQQVDADLVLLMDADGQDDPHDLPKLLAGIEAGAQMVTGRRVERQDRAVKRTTSRLYNGVTARLTGVSGSDFNSGFKLMRVEVVRTVEIYGELHRYIPVLAAWSGFVVTETPVNNRPRLHGHTKFGRNRFWRGLLDLITVKFLTTYDTRPFHLIGGAGLGLFLIGSALLAWMLVERLSGATIGSRPALLTGVMLTVVGVQLISVGLLAELTVFLHRRASEVMPPIEGGDASRP